MKKILFVAIVALLAVSAANAQEFNKGNLAVNAGIGFDNPVILGGSVEYGLFGNLFGIRKLTLGAGVEAGYYSDKKFGIKASVVNIGVRVPLHYSPVAKLDLYTAPALAHYEAKVGSKSGSGTEFGWTIIGARYYFSENIGIFGEVGSNNALGLAAGVAFKF